MSSPKMAWIRIRALFRKDRIERDMDAEFQFHLDMRTQDNIAAGMRPDDARRDALRRFGSVGVLKELGRDVRGAGILESLRQDLRYGLRTLRKNPGFTAVALLALAIGLGANTAVFNLADSLLFERLPVPDAEQMVRLYGSSDQQKFDSFSYANYLDLRDRSKNLSGLAAHQSLPLTITSGEEPEDAEGEIVSGNYFDVMRIPASIGRTLLPEDDRTPGAHAVAVIGTAFWKRHFGSDPAAVGKTLVINSHPFTVVGVVPESFKGTFPTFRTDIWLPLMMYEQVRPRGINITNRGWGWLHGTGRLKPGVSMGIAQAEMSTLGKQLTAEFPNANRGIGFKLISAAPLPDYFGSGASTIVLFFTLAASVVLLITCGNVASVLLARAMARSTEISLRQSLGASPSRLVRQWITESVLLSGLGTAAGFLVAAGLTAVVRNLAAQRFPGFSLDLALRPRLLLFMLASGVVSGILFGLFPALWVRKSDILAGLKSEVGLVAKYGTGSRIYGGLIVVQVALSLVLLIAAGLLLRSVWASEAFNPGFRTENLVVAGMDLRRHSYTQERQLTFYSDFTNRLRAIPGVRSVSSALVVPLNESVETRGVLIPGHETAPGKNYFSIDVNAVGPDYFATMEIPIVAGRAFNEDDYRKGSPQVAIVGEAMARRFWSGESAIGKTIRFSSDGPDVEIVGVVRDIKYYALTEDQRSYIYSPITQYNVGIASMIMRTDGDAARFDGLVKNELKAIDPTIALNAMSFVKLRKRALLLPRGMLAIAILFGAIATVLMAVGLYGVISYSVNRRIYEIGVRLALGAERRDILMMVIRQGLTLTAIGSAAGLILAAAVTRFLQAQLFGVATMDPLTYLTITFMMAFVAILACYVPARRATRIPPTIALKWGQP